MGHVERKDETDWVNVRGSWLRGGDSSRQQAKKDLAELCVCRLAPGGYQPTGHSAS